MQIEKAIEEFKQIYLDEIGLRLSNEEATEKAIGLLNLFKVLTGRDMENDNED